MKADAIALKELDNVATALRDLKAGEIALVRSGQKHLPIEVQESIPFGHKFAIMDINHGGVVVKYGEPTGLVTADILTGEHVHLHNVEGTRGRGDRK